ncbi:aminodeoxychorismate synthase component I [uncultured Microbacterium sp.]|uniref:aminodeoxychorismate synthase component I n=1 Tax=uncultured Microbacterium sp. TaxID=191216 RepID=UPI002606F6C8|nr:aminodeoxychorismate synthase component I [uncultured Microbacterium sp.]
MPPLSSRRLEAWVDPEILFLGGPARALHGFWLDAGTAAESGWSWLGLGEPDDPALRSLACGPSVSEVGPFPGGWVGWLSYDGGASAAGAPAVSDAPATLWLRVTRFVAVDHAAKALWLCAPGDELPAFASEVEQWATTGQTAPAVPAPAPTEATARVGPQRYAALIEECRAAIRAGDAYQLCLTTRFEVTASAPGLDPVATYLHLRGAQPAHHGGFVRSGEWALASASPEQFLQVADGTVRSRPIKGTRPRGANPEADHALAADLSASEKERAENVMIVDLMRNDLQRVCVPGTVAAERLLEIESYPAVHQLVSTVAGRLLPGTTVGDVLDATFPAGSMTGAPKLSAMTILHRLEGGPRGVYAGSFGWVGTDGSVDLAMVIRSVVFHPGGASVGAGGGITWLSDPVAEVAEVGVKARAPLAALGASLPPGW